MSDFYHRSFEGLWGQAFEIESASLASDSEALVFAETGLDSLADGPWRRVRVLESRKSSPVLLGAKEAEAFAPQWSPDGRWVAFLFRPPSDKRTRLAFWERSSGTTTSASLPEHQSLDGFSWHHSDDLVVTWSALPDPPLPAVARVSGAEWMPTVATRSEEGHQAVYVLRPGGESPLRLNPPVWVWEACWLDATTLAVIASRREPRPNWYAAEVGLLRTDGSYAALYRPTKQVGTLAVSPSGQRLSVVEGRASDRGMVAGHLVVIDPWSRALVEVPAVDADVTDAGWAGPDHLTYLGLLGQETLAGEVDLRTQRSRTTWRSVGTCGMPFPTGQTLGPGSALVAYEDWTTPRRLQVVGDPSFTLRFSVDSSAPGTAWRSTRTGTISEHRWTSPDGTALSGLLITPNDASPPYPLVLNIHGGPVWAWRNNWGIVSHTPIPLLVSRGFAVFNPNGRGSVGWGENLVEAVVQHMGEGDLPDYISAVGSLVSEGIADPGRLTVIGHSYGGLTTCNLVTRTSLFAAAVALSPVTTWSSQHHLSAIPNFDDIFVGGDPTTAEGPLTRAAHVDTPLLLICGESDSCTPANQAIEFYNALLRRSAADVALAIYPEEGHGLAHWPALLDQSVRIADWLESHAK